MLVLQRLRLFAFWLLLVSCFSASATAQSDLSGLWTGQSSGNQVTIEMRSGGFVIAVTGQRRAGQYGDGQFFRNAGSGRYLFTRPDGQLVNAQVLGPNSMRVTNPDGWTDVFIRSPRAAQSAPVVAPPMAAPAPALSPQQLRDHTVNAQLNRELDVLIAQYPYIPSCIWRDASKIQDPCAKHNALQGQRIIDLFLPKIEAIRRQVSERYYTRSKATWDKSGDQSVELCARLAISTTPCGLPVPGSIYGQKSRVIASDGHHALACVSLVDLASGNSSMSGGGRVLSNQCGGPVEVAWCSMGGECQKGAGNMWTVQAGRSWPVDREHEVRWGACHGANTIGMNRDSKGLDFVCSKPDK